MIWRGAIALTDGAVGLAETSGMVEFFIGLTVVGVGTSMPEMLVSVLSSFKGNSDISLGNIVGSDTFNIMMILGITAVIMPIPWSKRVVWRDIPLTVLSMVILTLLSFDATFFHLKRDEISRIDGAIMILLFIAYLIYMARVNIRTEQIENINKRMGPIGVFLRIVLGLAALIFGADIFVKNAEILAQKIGVSDSVIALTVVSMGTSLPELATSIVAASKGRNEIAVANILGSNIANILLIIGTSAVVRPLVGMNINIIDYLVMIGGTVLLWLFSFTFKKYRLDRIEGSILIVLYCAYIAWLIK